MTIINSNCTKGVQEKRNVNLKCSVGSTVSDIYVDVTRWALSKNGGRVMIGTDWQEGGGSGTGGGEAASPSWGRSAMPFFSTDPLAFLSFFFSPT